MLPPRRPVVRAWILLALLVSIPLGCGGPGNSESREGPDEEVIRHNIVGTAYLGQQKWAEAEAAFDLALAKRPDEPLLLNNKAVALIQQGRIDEAEALLRQALEADPDHPWAHYNLGSILKNRGEFEPAVEHFEAVEAHDPDDVMTHYNLGMVYSRIGREREAEAEYRRALELDPTHVSSLYALGRLLLQSGDQQRGVELITRSQEIRARSGLDEAVGSQYGEQGPYAMGADYPGDALPAPAAVDAAFTVARSSELAGGTIRSYAPAPGPDDGRPVLYLVDGEGALYRLGTAEPVPVEPRERSLVAVTAGDLDDDGTVDTVALSARPGELLVVVVEDDGSTRTVGAPLSVQPAVRTAAMTVVDRDHDGDLDVFACWAGDDGDGCLIGTNDGDGNLDLRDSAAHGFRPAPGASAGPVDVAFSDVDNDRDVDLLLARPGRIELFVNQRDASFLDVSTESGLGETVRDAIGTLQIADLDKDGQMDLVVGTADGVRVLLNDRGRFAPGPSFAGEPGRVVVLDHDDDGFLDLAVSGSGGVRIHRNLGVGQWDLEGRLVATPGDGTAEPLAALDVDLDGDLDLVAASGATVALLENESDHTYHSIRIVSRGIGDNRGGIGAKVEVLAGALRQKFEVRDPLPLHVGLGPRERVETIRYLWPSGVLQDEIDLPAGDRVEVAQLDRKGTSCPLLYAWRDGAWRFVTDFLGGSAVGYLHRPGVYGTPDTDEYVLIEDGLDTAEDGTLRLRVNNQLQEVIWFDQLELVVVDHPEGTRVYPDERLMPGPPFARSGLFASDDIRPVRKVVAVESGADLTDRLVAADRRYARNFEQLPFKGYATDHTIEIDLGHGIPRGGRVVLLLDGWIDYADSSANLAAHQAGVQLVPPVLTVADGRGGWLPTEHRMGFPAGLPKTMTVNLTGLFPTDDLRVRIRTNMRIYWDRARVLVGGESVALEVRRLPARIARLEFGGFPRPSSPDDLPPFGYDPQDVTEQSPWTVHAGRYTAFGDVRGQLQTIDDRLVTTRSGDQIELRFADPGPPAPGRSRSYLLFADGFGKDMDPNSAANLRVGPVPFHGMPGYPYPEGIAPPVEPAPEDPSSRIVLDSERGTPGAVPLALAARRDDGDR